MLGKKTGDQTIFQMIKNLIENLNTIIFVAGLGLVSAGLWGWFSWHVAATFVGAVLNAVPEKAHYYEYYANYYYAETAG